MTDLFSSTSSNLPPLLPFLRFLTTSLTFMNTLSKVEVYLDEVMLGCIEKSRGMTRVLPLSRSLRTKSPGGMMDVVSFESVGKLYFIFEMAFLQLFVNPKHSTLKHEYWLLSTALPIRSIFLTVLKLQALNRQHLIRHLLLRRWRHLLVHLLQ